MTKSTYELFKEMYDSDMNMVVKRLDKLEKEQKHQHDEWVKFFWEEAWKESKKMDDAKKYIDHLKDADHESEYIKDFVIAEGERRIKKYKDSLVTKEQAMKNLGLQQACEYTPEGRQCKCLQQKTCGHDWISLGAQTFCRKCSIDKVNTTYKNEV